MSKGEVTESSIERLKRLPDKDKVTLGFLYPHTPITLLLAHGLRPHLMRADQSVSAGFEDSLQTFSCAFSRNIFSQRAASGFREFGGIVFPGNTCDALQNVGDVWRKRFAHDKVLRITYPAANYSEATVSYLAEELRAFSAEVNRLYGKSFSPSDYQIAVTLMNDFREYAQFLYAARLIDPGILGYTALVDLIIDFLQNPGQETVGTIIDQATKVRSILDDQGVLGTVEELKAALLEEITPEIDFTLRSDSPRIIVIGGMVDPVNFARLVAGIENANDATIVLDILSFSFRIVFTPTIDSSDDPYLAIAQSLLHAPLEPTQEGLNKRMEKLEGILKHLHIDGIIVCEQSFCEPDEFESPSVLRVAESVGIPSLRLPLDPEMSDRGRLEGRIQTFLETIWETKKNE